MTNSIIKEKNIRWYNSIWIFAIISLLFYLVAIFVSNFNKSDIGEDYSQRKLQNYIIHVQNVMEDINSNFTQNINDSVLNNSSQLYFSEGLFHITEKEDIHAFVIVGDEIKAWSDNDFIINTPVKNNKTYFYKSEIGDFIINDIKKENYTLRLSFRIYRSYNITNEYLKSALNPIIGINKPVELNYSLEDVNPVYDIEGNYLFSSQWQVNNEVPQEYISFTFAFFILSLVFLLTFAFKILQKFIANNNVLLIASLIFAAAIPYVWQHIVLSDLVCQSSLFSPAVFASSFFNSLGNLVITMIAFLYGFYAISTFFHSFDVKKIKSNYKLLSYLALTILFLILLQFIRTIVSDLIFNSTISFTLARISEISFLAVYGLISLGIGIIIFLITFFEANKIFRLLKSWQQWVSLLLFIVIELAIVYFDVEADCSILIFFIIISIINIGISRQKISKTQTTAFTIILLLFSLLVAYWFNNLNAENERLSRVSIIQSLAINQDPQAEFLFTKVSKEMYADEDLKGKFIDTDISFDSLKVFIENKYFKNQKHFEKYDFQTTICTQDLLLRISPQNIEINCDTFFYQNLIQFGKLTDDKNLYRLDYGTGQVNYLGVFRFYNITNDGYQVFTVYMEINSKLKRKGFTRVLMAKEYDPFAKINNYSLARYQSGNRVEKYGEYAFPEHIPQEFVTDKDLSFYDSETYSHLIYKLKDNKVYVLSLKIQPVLGRLAPFSYLFILFGLLFGLISFFKDTSLLSHLQFRWTFGNRLQITMVAIILSSFTIISIITILYINDLNESKNKAQLTRLAVSLQTEFEHKLAAESDLSKVDIDYLNTLLQKFSKVFDTDINIYKLNGSLIASTRYKVFDRNLMSSLINPQAYKDLKYDHQSIFLARENIGLLQFSSAYMPFHNSEGEIIAFLNLPYFAKEEVLKNEVSSLLMTLMNVYTLIVVISILLILFVSRYISRPLSMLRSHLQHVVIGEENNKIEWHGIEEIQDLVNEYNKMIDALALSSDKLAKTERESAWREMAKQVAHEIKNPLTPMKLSVQYMMHSYDENGENQKEKLQKLANTIVEQIDVLTDIATAFSDFANMPKSLIENNNMGSIISTVADTYKDLENVDINLELSENIDFSFDKSQWMRVYNNLFKNSIQAAISNQRLKIDVKMFVDDNMVNIIFADNGRGFDTDMHDKIFVPNFTTKTTGSGLGLAMVKNIINNSGGGIDFSSTPGEGTIFKIKLKING